MAKSPKSATPKPRKPKTPKRAKAATAANGEATSKHMSGLDAAEQVLRAAGEPLRPAVIYERAKAEGLWSPAGKTPIATLAAALCISVKKGKGRFTKAGRGLFGLTGA